MYSIVFQQRHWKEVVILPTFLVLIFSFLSSDGTLLLGDRTYTSLFQAGCCRHAFREYFAIFDFVID